MLTFSERYLRPQVVQEDAVRMRVQLHALFERHVSEDRRFSVSERMRLQSGIEVPNHGYGLMWDRFFKKAELRDVLDCISATYMILRLVTPEKVASWIQGVTFIFDVQNLKYRIDVDGSVLLRVDEQFEADRTATLAGLDNQRHQGVRAEFDGAYHALAAQHPNGKLAIRGVFEACEILFKLMFPVAQRLAAPQLGQHLTPFIAEHYSADRPAQQAADKLLQGFTDWVAAAQFYRHGQGQEEPNQPPLEIAVLVLSAGAAHLRWLIHLDRAVIAAQG